MGFGNEHRESGPRFNISSERRYNTLPVSLLCHKFVTSLRPTIGDIKNPFAILHPRCREIMLTKFGGDRMKTLGRVHEITLNVFSKQSNMADFLLGGADWQIDCQHESRLAVEIYRCMNFGDCR